MDVEKSITEKNIIILGVKILTVRTKTELNYNENVTPIQPILEINLNDTHNNN